MSQWQTAAMVLAVLSWWLSPPSSLGDLARREALRRQMTPKATRTLTNQDVSALPPRALPSAPASGEPAAGESAAAAKPSASPDRPEERASAGPHDEAWWRAKIAAARAALERDQLLADAMQSRINALTNDVTSRDDPAQRAVLIEQRLRAVAELDRLKKALAADRKAIDDLGEDARTQGVPPGWIRGD
jgi:cell division septation protein DedD